ncbi:monocarboxylate transporter 2-like isoform X2 [Littorina saxatilis]|uniref:monocarboxylate transporter 2-like isoform X2 n=1 Tax=Littorina saxatilis TaxID=31220 RepID=UPI0038B62D7C
MDAQVEQGMPDRKDNVSNKQLSTSDENRVQEVTSDQSCADAESNNDGVPYDRGWAWVIVFGSFINFGLLSGYVKSTGVFFVELLDYFQSTNTHTSLLFAVKGALCSIGGLFVMNVLVGRLGCRKTVLIGGACLSLSAILASLANDLTLLILLQAVLLEVLIAAYFKRRRSLAIAIGKCGASIGSMTIPPLVVYLLSKFGLKGAFLLTGGICLHCFPSALLFRPTSYFSISKRRSRRAKLDQVVGEETVKLIPFGNNQEVPVDKLPGNMEEDSHVFQKVRHNDEKGLLSLLESDNTSKKMNGGSRPMADSDGFINDQGIQKPALKLENENEVTSAEEDQNCEYSLQHEDPLLSKQSNIRNIENNQNGSAPNVISRVATPGQDSDFRGVQQTSDGKTQSTGTTADSENEKSAQHIQHKSCTQKALGCLKSCAFTLDFSLFRSASFRLLFTCCALFPTVNIAVQYLPVVARESGISETRVANLLTIIGALDLVSRLGSGVVADRKFMRVSTMIAITFVILGVMYNCVRFMTSFSTFVLFAVIQGLLGSVVNCMIPVLVVDSVGLDHMAKGIGFYQVAAGTFQAVIHPVLGQIRDVTGSYITVYHVLGGFVLLAAILLCLDTPVRRLDARHGKDPE